MNLDAQLVEIIAVFVESIGVLLAEKRTALYLALATILTIIIFFLV